MKLARATLIPLFLGALLISLPAYAAKLYKWVDEQGRVSYQDSPPPKESNFSETAIVDPDAVDPATKSYQDKITAAASKSPVVLFSIPECDGCDLIRSYLEKRNVPFEEKNVEDNPEVQDELKGVAGRLEVPLVVLGERVLRGYSRSVLETEFDSAGFPKISEKPDGIATPTAAALPPATPATQNQAPDISTGPLEEIDVDVQPATDEDIFREPSGTEDVPEVPGGT